jgi:hypothetical protein
MTRKSLLRILITYLERFKTDTYKLNFLKGFDYNQLHITLSEIVGSNNLSVIFYENSLISIGQYFKEILDLLSLSNSEHLNY